MDSIRQVLSETFRRERGVDTEESTQLVCSYWTAAVGQKIADHTKPVRVLGKRLIIDVDEQEWRSALASISRKIAEKVNQAVGSDLLEDIDFRVAAPRRRGPARTQSSVGLTARNDVETIQDPHLRLIYQRSREKALQK